MTARTFIKKIGDAAVKHYRKYKILPSLTIAQAIVESGWGKSNLSSVCHNYFGMKWSEGCGCDYKNYTTLEQRANGTYYTVTAKFRKYKTISDGIEGYYKFLQYPRYKNLVGVTDYKKACDLIRRDGWATALDYTKLLIAVIEQNNLTKYDNEAIKSCLKDVKKAAGKKQDKPVKSNKPKVKKRQPKIGDLVIVDGKIYGNGDGSGGSLSKKSEKMFVVDIVDSKKYKYFIGVASLKTSARQGWGNLKCIKKA